MLFSTKESLKLVGLEAVLPVLKFLMGHAQSTDAKILMEGFE